MEGRGKSRSSFFRILPRVAPMEKWLFWFEELSKEHNDLVGKKCAHLGEMQRIGMRVPYGFAVSVQGFETFMRETDTVRELEGCIGAARDDLKRVEARLEASCQAREIIEAKPVPAALEDEIRRYYRALCDKLGGKDIPVAVRSSGAVSMPGQMETYLNVTGEASVVEHVRKVWSSAYTARAITFRLSEGLPLEWAPVGVAVMMLVDAKSAGVVLTVLPTTGDTTKIVIEGNWGLGESVVSGETTPDSFTVDKQTMEIVDRRIAHKVGMVDREAAGTRYMSVPEELRDVPCVTDDEIREIARVALSVEEHFGVPQDMEWVTDKHLQVPDNLFWVQARPARYVKVEKTEEIDYLIDLMVRIFK